jgi:hypothetical protein
MMDRIQRTADRAGAGSAAGTVSSARSAIKEVLA